STLMMCTHEVLCSDPLYLVAPCSLPPTSFSFFFFTATATTEIYTLSLHDALPIYGGAEPGVARRIAAALLGGDRDLADQLGEERSEEHTSELQSRGHLVCRLLLEKKKNNKHHFSDRV